MTKLEELMKLNNSVDTIIASAMEDNKRVEAEITATEIVLWNKMWDDIEEWYNKGYVEAAVNIYSSIEIPYGYHDRTAWNYYIKLYKHQYHMPCIYLDISGGHREIKRIDYFTAHEKYCKHITTLLLNWKKTKNEIEQKLVDSIAENIKRKTKKTENTINYNSSLLKALKEEN